MNLSVKRTASCSCVENVKDKENTTSLLDLPEMILDCIFELLLPADLCNIIEVCSFFREICTSDHLWEKHLMKKWGKVIGDAAYRKWIGDLAYREWQSHVASRIRPNFPYQRRRKRSLFNSPYYAPLAVSSKPEKSCKLGSTLPAGSVKAFYLALESGKFWFPAQVYYGESGYTGYMLLCYDAQVSYDYRTDTFRARYPSQVWGATEENVKWDRIRAPPVDTPPFTPHVSDCLHDLKPGDHIEIQWRSHKKFPYGWWYAQVGHLEKCDRNVNHCRCQYSDSIVVEFNQYSPRPIKTIIYRKHQSGEGNEIHPLYGGIRKLSNEEEITKWLRFMPH